MRRNIVVLLILIVAGSVPGFAQDTDRFVQTYRDRFREASPETRLQILRSADAARAALSAVSQ